MDSTMQNWPQTNAIHDTMWAPRKKSQWLVDHGGWLAEQCSDVDSRVLSELLFFEHYDSKNIRNGHYE